MILYVSFESGRFNLGMFIFQSITMAIIIYVLIKFSYRTIDVKSEEYTYKGLRKVTVDYKSISRIYILEREDKIHTTFSLILVVGSTNWQISDIQRYKRGDIEFLIDKISIVNRNIALISQGLKDNLDNILWLHN